MGALEKNGDASRANNATARAVRGGNFKLPLRTRLDVSSTSCSTPVLGDGDVLPVGVSIFAQGRVEGTDAPILTTVRLIELGTESQGTKFRLKVLNSDLERCFDEGAHRAFTIFLSITDLSGGREPYGRIRVTVDDSAAGAA